MDSIWRQKGATFSDKSARQEFGLTQEEIYGAMRTGMFSSDRQAAMEKEILDTLVPPDGDAEQVGTIIQAMEIVDGRRKRLFPNLRRFVVDYDLQVSEGRVALNVLSESMSADR